MGLMAAIFPRALNQGFANAGHGEYRANAGDGIARGDENRVGGKDRIDDSGSRFGVRRSGEAHGVHRVLIPALHEIFFKTQLARRRIHAGFDARYRSWEERALSRQVFLR
jgi:hypothetical protein